MEDTVEVETKPVYLNPIAEPLASDKLTGKLLSLVKKRNIEKLISQYLK